MYIYHLPYEEKNQLCYILDQYDKWEELGRYHMKYNLYTIETIRKEIFRGNSPTEELLTIWGHQNHTVLELFVLLSRLEHYQAMTVIKHLVDPKYYYLMEKTEEKCSKQNLNIRQEAVQVLHNNENNNKSIVHPQLFGRNNLPRLETSRINVNDISSVAESASTIPHISYEELEKSTNNWNNNVVLGKGGFGTVYKGIWKFTQVAIKRLEQRADNPEYQGEHLKQSIRELHCLNAYRHDNVLPLYGYSMGGPHPCLIYQYMAGGSLEDRLRVRHPSQLLNWPTRLNIAIGTARGLQFLHTSMVNGKPLVHGDIKSANILLDSNDQPRIGDFGLAREGPQSQHTYVHVTKVQGTLPYLPDEFLRAKKFSTKVDTFSFGIVLFEIATSLGVYSKKREDKFLKDLVVNYEGDILDLKDKRVEGYDECFKGLVDIGKMCVNKRAKERPEMVSVLILLESFFAYNSC